MSGSRRRAGDASGPGLTLIVVIAIFAILGHIAGSRLGIPIAGSLVGGFLGLLGGFSAIYWRYRDL